MKTPDDSKPETAFAVRQEPIQAADVPPRVKPSNYPPLFAAKVAGRQKRQLGDVFGLSHFGVNLTTLAPGGQSALLHRHTVQEEFVYVLQGTLTLRTGEEEYTLGPGACMGFLPNGLAHHLVNNTAEDAQYLEIGDRMDGDSGEYPEDDLVALREDGAWVFTRKDGSAW